MHYTYIIMSLCIKGARCLRLLSSKKYDIDFIIFKFFNFHNRDLQTCSLYMSKTIIVFSLPPLCKLLLISRRWLILKIWCSNSLFQLTYIIYLLDNTTIQLLIGGFNRNNCNNNNLYSKLYQMFFFLTNKFHHSF